MKTKELCLKIKEFVDNLKSSLEDDGDILILIYNKDEFSYSGFGCKACANDAAREFLERNKDAKHEFNKFDKKDIN